MSKGAGSREYPGEALKLQKERPCRQIDGWTKLRYFQQVEEADGTALRNMSFKIKQPGFQLVSPVSYWLHELGH